MNIIPNFNDYDENLDQLISTIDEYNPIAREAATVQPSVRGDQRFGDKKTRALYVQANNCASVKCLHEKTLKDLVNNPMDLLHLGLVLVRYGSPLNRLALCEATSIGFGNTYIVHQVICGHLSEASVSASPASSIYLSDSTHRKFIMTAGQTDTMEPWKAWATEHAVAETVLGMSYEMEMDGTTMAARYVGDSPIRTVLRTLAFIKQQASIQRKRCNSTASRGALQLLASADRLPAEIANGEPVSMELIHQFGEQVENKILMPIREIFEKPVDCEVFPRSIGSTMVYKYKSSQVGKHRVLNLSDIEKTAKALLAELKERLANDPGMKVGQSFHRDIDVCDLISKSGTRKLMVLNLIGREYLGLIEGSKTLSQMYREQGKTPPSCPAPYLGTIEVRFRLKAAALARLLTDYESNVPIKLSKLNLCPPCHFQDEAQQKAAVQCYEKLIKMTDMKLSLLCLIYQTPALASFADAYILHWECEYNYIGGGVDSVDQLLFPAFFFHQDALSNMLSFEYCDFKNAWMNIRGYSDKLKQFQDKSSTVDLYAIKDQIINPIFLQLKSMNLFAVSNDLNEIKPPWSDVKDVFFVPKPEGDGELHDVSESQSPVSFRQAPPGDGNQYDQFKAALQPAIEQLKKIDFSPRAIKPTLRHCAIRGHNFDPQRLHLYKLGQDAALMQSIRYVAKPVNSRPYLVSILFDFSGSMGEARVNLGKEVSVILAEGLQGCFEVDINLYTCEGSLFQLTSIFDSTQRKLIGKDALAAMFTDSTRTGTGWNPDAACLLGLAQEKTRIGKRGGTVVHITDASFCGSLNLGLSSAIDEMAYAVKKIQDDGFKYVLVRVNNGESPFAKNVAHDYVVMGDRHDSVELSKKLGCILLGHAQS